MTDSTGTRSPNPVPAIRRSRWSARRIALVVVAAVGFAFLVATVATATAVVRGGTIAVAVDTDAGAGDSIRVVVPGVLVDVALALAPDSALEEAAREAGPYLATLAAAGRALEECPDAVFVEVRDGDDHVVVEKRDGRIRVRVESGRDLVSVSMPARVVARVAQRLERAA